jgi:hypothetical protein
VGTILSKEVIPFAPVVTNINILPVDNLSLVTCLGVEYRTRHLTKVSSHVLWICVLVQFFSTPLNATSVVILWTKDKIYIAVDSLLAFKGTKKNAILYGCKLHRVKELAFASSGIYGYPDTKFLASSTISEAILRAHSIQEAATLAQQTLTPQLQEAMRHMKTHYPRQYAKAKYELYQFVIAGMLSSGKTGVAIGTFPIVSGNGPSENTYFDDLKDNDIGSRFLGAASSPYRYTKQHPTWYTEGSLDTMARKFVGLAIKELPNKINGKVSIVEISGKGWKWLDKGECQE